MKTHTLFSAVLIVSAILLSVSGSAQDQPRWMSP
jgi:hypothetical protein